MMAYGILKLQFSMPNAIVLDIAGGKVKVVYPARHSHITLLIDWAGVLSYVTGGGDRGNTVNTGAVALVDPSGKRLRLTARPALDVTTTTFRPHYADCEELRVLRQYIAALTGLKDLGFVELYLDDPTYKNLPYSLYRPDAG